MDDDREEVCPLHQPSAGSPPRPGEELRVSANKNRLVQVRRTGKRKLFDAGRKAVFLEWFAATCNASLSAAKAGVAYQTPFKHRMKDPEFEAEWDAALAQGYARMEARSVQEAHVVVAKAATKPSTIAPSGNGPPPPGELVEEKFDPELALHLLREHKRRLAGSADKRKNLRTTARVATEQEVIAALEKRLRAFALRQGSGQALRASKNGKKG